MGLLKPCVDKLGFDDRWLMRLGIPIMSIIMPAMLNMPFKGIHEYVTCHIPESFAFVIGFWVFYRTAILKLHGFFPNVKDAAKRVVLEVLFIAISAPFIKIFLGWLVSYFITIENFHGDLLPNNIQGLVKIYVPSALIVALYEALFYFYKYKASIIENERLEKVHAQTQLDNLRNQINPHFLFNSLNTLMNLIPINQEQAMDYLSKLSKFYRYSVSAQDEMKVPLSKELESAQLYAQLLSVRFKDALEIHIPTHTGKEYSILPMSLQLLIENAVKHNIVSKSQPLSITIHIDEQTQYITIINNIQKKLEAVSSTGMGLKNIQERFAFFTDRQIICSPDDDHFRISLPLL
jgi:sensor histidine kinase YesM